MIVLIDNLRVISTEKEVFAERVVIDTSDEKPPNELDSPKQQIQGVIDTVAIENSDSLTRQNTWWAKINTLVSIVGFIGPENIFLIFIIAFTYISNILSYLLNYIS